MINCRKIRVSNKDVFRFALSLNSNIDLKGKLDVLVDFRSSDKYFNHRELARKYINIPMSDVGIKYRNDILADTNDLLYFYIEIVDTYRAAFKALIDLVNNNTSIGIGCYFGKDRTGIATYLIGRKYGVPWPLIESDYEESESEIMNNIDSLSYHWKKKGLSKDSYEKRMRCPGHVLVALETYICRIYGSVENYLSG
ncbi:tyrosine-protein phosphatase [Xenorhabdus bovienii]|uniref:tyrosine-protein phosphatase n=1 Tax=Xenorhabdus bovienii TaxID=40576 RepID=UPI0023B33693|nr:tyrosine-protein phosphatase [Xenorhabdus bovienii]MDE9541071.1 tyrosine-protein phosphatase [Xenorhabdus bovienii]